jgi:hypothetical protein
MTAFDRSLCARAAASTVALTLLALTIVVVTDEASSSFAMRVARLSALGPVLAAFAAFGVAAHARARGELRSLEALGLSPVRSALGAAVAAWCAGAVSLAVSISPFADTTSLFPAVRPVVAWALDPTRTVARAAGVAVFSSGDIAISRASAVHQPFATTAWMALPCLLPLALLAPVWAVEKMSVTWRALSLFASGAVAIAALHFIAARRVPAIDGLAVGIPLLAALVHARRAP